MHAVRRRSGYTVTRKTTPVQVNGVEVTPHGLHEIGVHHRYHHQLAAGGLLVLGAVQVRERGQLA